jgi:XTP/dITP diphosphohydrolase
MAQITDLFTPQESERRIVVIASNNAHKVQEIREILAEVLPGMDFKPMREIGGFAMPPEDGATFEDNAFIKADYIHEVTGLPAIADDSGLVVDALDGAPGVRSARYAGEEATDAQNNAKLLDALRDVPDGHRSARFVCTMAFVTDAVHIAGVGLCEGSVGRTPRGAGGFGYDPLFWPQEEPGRTMAELSEQHKNAISHRRHAAEDLAARLRALSVPGTE